MSRHPIPQATRSKPSPRFALRPTAVAVHLLLAGMAIGGWVGAAQAQTAATASTRSYNIPAGPLNVVLTRFLGESGVLLSGSTELAQGKQSPGVQGNLTPDAALAALLAGTGLQAVADAQGRYVLKAAPVVAPHSGGDTIMQSVIVTAGADLPGSLPKPYAGGQVARGGRLGLLGNTDVMDAPFNIISYTEKVIADQQASTLTEVLDNDASVRRSSPSSGLADYFTVRGFSFYTSDVAFNGLYGLAGNWGAIPTEFAERVEVLKGPSALLGGMSPGGVVGGAVNVVTKRADEQPLTRLTLGVESDSHAYSHLDLSRRFGQDGAWGLRFNGAYGSGDTYIDGQSRKNTTGAVALDYRGERVRLVLDAWRFERKHEGGSSLYTGLANSLTSIPAAPDGSTNIYPGGWARSTTQGAILSSEFDINSAWTAYAKLGQMSYDYRGANGGSSSALQQNGNVTARVFNYPYGLSATSGEAGVRGSFQTGAVGHELALSVSHLEQESEYIYSLATTSSNIYNPVAITNWPADPGAPPKGWEGTLSSIAIADTLKFLDDRVLLTVGVRRQKVKSDTFNASGAVTSSYDQSAATPMVGLVVKPRDNLSVYANYIEGLSQGTVVGAGYQNTGDVFPPYKTKQIEIGAKLETGRFTNTLSLFQIDKPSTLADYSASATLPTMRLDGQQRNRGIEWTIFGELTSSLRMLGGMTYIDGRLTRTQGGAQDDNRAPGATPWAANLGAEWDLPGVPGLTLNGRVIHTGSQYVNNANTLKLPDWTRIDVGVRYAAKIDGKPVVFRAGIRNLLDRKYWEGVYSSGVITLGAPRTFHLSAAVDF